MALLLEMAVLVLPVLVLANRIIRMDTVVLVSLITGSQENDCQDWWLGPLGRINYPTA